MNKAAGLILFGHGARDPRWADTMKALAAQLHAVRPELAVELAFLELMQPTLAEAVARLNQRGIGAILVMPVFLAAGGHVLRDLPEQLGELSLHYEGLDLRVAPALGSMPEVIAAMARVCVEMMAQTFKDEMPD